MKKTAVDRCRDGVAWCSSSPGESLDSMTQFRFREVGCEGKMLSLQQKCVADPVHHFSRLKQSIGKSPMGQKKKPLRLVTCGYLYGGSERIRTLKNTNSQEYLKRKRKLCTYFWTPNDTFDSEKSSRCRAFANANKTRGHQKTFDFR